VSLAHRPSVPPEARAATSTAEHVLTFSLARGSYALRASQVEGVGTPGPLRHVPGAPPEVLGLCACHGVLLCVLDVIRLLDERPLGGPPALLRLARPAQHVALWLPAPPTLTTLDGPERPTLLEPSALLEALERRWGRAP